MDARALSSDFSIRFGASFVILWTPFFFYSHSRGHSLPNASVFYSVILFALIALVSSFAAGKEPGLRRVVVFTLFVAVFVELQVTSFSGVPAYAGIVGLSFVFWSIRKHLALILLITFVTILIAISLDRPGEKYVDQELTTHAGDGLSGPKPAGLVIHLILDGFAGHEGIPKDLPGGAELRAEIVDFFERYGFTLYPNAISEYTVSRDSISSILNFESSSTPGRHYRGKHPFVLKHNAYFEVLHARQFEIHVTQSTYMDFCVDAPVPVATCLTYRYDGTDWLQASDLSDLQKMWVFLGMFLDRSDFFEAGWGAYDKVRNAASELRVHLPDPPQWDGHVSPITSLAALDRFREKVVAAPLGTAHFGHLLLPHGPYVYDASCALRNESLNWLSYRPLNEKYNTAVGREQRYQQYFLQARCTIQKLRALFDELEATGRWQKAEIILHGDHGSRIYETAPRARNRERLTAIDLADGFSTLFAVKSARSPQLSAGVVGELKPVSRLLAIWSGIEIETEGGTSSASESLAAEPEVYLQGEDDESWLSFPWQRLLKESPRDRN